MNEILRKKIEDKAADYADNLYPEHFPQYRTAEAAFKGGAEFALSHQWISIDEALPDDNEIALFIDQYGSMQLLTMADIRKQDKIWDAMLMGVSRDLLEESIVCLDKIVAWMPIPEFKNKK